MKPPTDEEIDRLLASRLRDTTPEFEARWRDLQRELRQAPPRRRSWFAWPSAWAGLAAAGAAAALLLALWPAAPVTPPRNAPEFSPAFAELFEMNEVLAHALPLIDPENRDALLHLPVNPPPHT